MVVVQLSVSSIHELLRVCLAVALVLGEFKWTGDW